MPLAIYNTKQYDIHPLSLLYKTTSTVGCRDKRHHFIRYQYIILYACSDNFENTGRKLKPDHLICCIYVFIEEAGICSTNDSGEKGYKVTEQILFNCLALCSPLYSRASLFALASSCCNLWYQARVKSFPRCSLFVLPFKDILLSTTIKLMSDSCKVVFITGLTDRTAIYWL